MAEIIDSEDNVVIIIAEPDTIITLVTEADPEVHVIECITTGPQGATGERGEDGKDGEDVSGGLSGDFSWGSVSSILLGQIDQDSIVKEVRIIVLEAFDGVGAGVTIGTDDDHDLLTTLGDVDLTQVGTYIISPGHKFPGDEDVKIFNTTGSGASTGSGTVTINS